MKADNSVALREYVLTLPVFPTVRENAADFCESNLFSNVYPQPTVHTQPHCIIFQFSKTEPHVDKYLRVEIGHDYWNWKLKIDIKKGKSTEYPITRTMGYEGKLLQLTERTLNLCLPSEVDEEMGGDDPFLTDTKDFPVWNIMTSPAYMNISYWDGFIRGYRLVDEKLVYVEMVEETEYKRHRLYKVYSVPVQVTILIKILKNFGWIRKRFFGELTEIPVPSKRNQIAWMTTKQ